MEADCVWPFPSDAGDVAPGNEVLDIIRQWTAWREYAQIKQWQRERDARVNALADAELELLEDIEALQLKPRTVKKYAAAFAHFRAWCALEENWFEGAPMPALPACAGMVATYLLEQLIRGRGYAACRLASAAISDAHAVAGHPNPCSDLLVTAALRYAKRTAKHFKAKQQQPVGPFSDEEEADADVCVQTPE